MARILSISCIACARMDRNTATPFSVTIISLTNGNSRLIRAHSALTNRQG